MRKFFAGVSVGLFSVAICGVASAGVFPTKARLYSTAMVRAYNQCTPGGLSVTTPGNTTPGCLATISDPLPPGAPLGATMNFANLKVKRFPGGSGGQGRIALIGRGFQPGQRVKVRLTLRTTRPGISTKHPPLTNQYVTFSDTTIDCGTGGPGNCFVARPNGALAVHQALDACLTQNAQSANLAKGNVEIVDSSLVNCDTGGTVAVPGVLN